MNRLPTIETDEIPEHVITELPEVPADDAATLAELGLIDVLNWSTE